MALIKCPKCGREISDKAKKCVGCGWKVKLGAINLKEDPTISDNSLQKEKLTNESVKAMVDQKQKGNIHTKYGKAKMGSGIHICQYKAVEGYSKRENRKRTWRV